MIRTGRGGSGFSFSHEIIPETLRAQRFFRMPTYQVPYGWQAIYKESDPRRVFRQEKEKRKALDDTFKLQSRIASFHIPLSDIL